MTGVAWRRAIIVQWRRCRSLSGSRQCETIPKTREVCECRFNSQMSGSSRITGKEGRTLVKCTEGEGRLGATVGRSSILMEQGGAGTGSSTSAIL